MGAFFAVNEPDADRAKALWQALEASMSEQGFDRPQVFGSGAVRVAVYPKLSNSPGTDFEAQVCRDGDTHVAAFTGTPVVAGSAGIGAAQAMLRRYEGVEPDWSDWIGQFCALNYRDGHLDLFLDPMGIYKVYQREDARVFSSSFLAVAATLRQRTANAQGVYEYLAQEATYGRDTVVNGVLLAASGGVYRLDGGSRFTPWSVNWPDCVRAGEMALHVEATLERLRVQYGLLESAFGERMDTALSGGYDSRLILALLHERGLSPAVHVYGAPNSADVTVALTVANGEGFALHHEDKGKATPIPVDAFADVVERNFLTFDGYPCAGIFEGGVDLSTRFERASGGRLTLNGGGGEVFRNFFYLPDRPMRTLDVVHSFYNRYDPAVHTERFNEKRYLHTLVEKMRAVLGTQREPLGRVQVERLYPEFRCQFWMGRNNAINNRLGFAITPFIDPILHANTLVVPMKYKNHGRLEAAMIAAVSTSLARYASDYGHSFDVPPPLSRIAKDYATMLRPPWLRRRTFRLRNRSPHPRGRYLSEEYLGEVIDPALPRLSRFVRPQRCYDAGTFQRACTLEYVFKRLDVSCD